VEADMTPALKRLLPLLLILAIGRAGAESVAIIGHPGLTKVDAAMVKKLFTGRAIEVGGEAVTVVNISPGNPVRGRFLAAYLGQDEEQYVAYWTVRRFIGKGTPPRDLSSVAEVVSFVQANPGAIGYIDSTDLRPGINVLSRK
jgi:hypothetical protein